ncbi:GNAT family N-acetyltransferase [Rhizobium sp. AG207R]|uniref:GNAT family N-acetyltransferase n=1 Tax=Rhizobium sp. AG207R TaxID=2802287 RepID=UPI0022AC5252|nr:GNAT family N-acetyltransferase [Rhizobium sp. AG207R]MCZ3377805.1 GNAT family N-acetyltransferase [Rhizobium sp. AG207R]
MLQIRPAIASEAPEIALLLRETAAWLARKGEPLWNPEVFTTSLVAKGINNSEWILAKWNSELAGIVLRQTQDVDAWPDRKPGDAFYLHKLCVSRAFAGVGISCKLIEWVSQSAEMQGYGYLRLDCAPRSALLRLYSSLGFTLIDRYSVGGFSACRFEKKLSASV